MSSSFLDAAISRTADASLLPALATAAPPPDSSAFVDWCKALRVDVSKVTFTHSATEGVGLAAATDLAADAAVITVPLAAALMQDAAGPQCAELLGALEPTHALALAICLATGALPIAFEPWTSMWPASPVGGWGFGAAAWASLEWCTEAVALHAAQQKAARAAYNERIVAHFSNADCPSWERFVWALSMVASRAAAVHMSGEAADARAAAAGEQAPGERGDRRLAIIPLVDLLNHRATPSARLTYEPAAVRGGAFVVRTTGPMRAGDALSISYGPKENAELLVAYGFALPTNPSDTAGLRVPLAADDPLRALKLSMAPRGLQHVVESMTTGQELMGALRWAQGGEEGPAAPRAPVAEDALVLAVGIASAASMPEVMGALSIHMVNHMGGSAPAVPAATWHHVATACEEALARLPAADDGAAAWRDEPAIAVTLAARRALLRAAAEKAATGTALVEPGSDCGKEVAEEGGRVVV